MKKSTKVFLATLGAIEIGFSILIPIAIALLLIATGSLTEFQGVLLVILGSLASL